MSEDDRAEGLLLLDALRGRWAEARERAARRPPRPAVLVELAVACDVHPYLHAVAERGPGAEVLGPEVMGHLAALRHRVRKDNLLLLARAEEALDLLRAAGIVPVVLKGLDAIHRFVGFDERTLDDADLLVHPREVPAAVAALSAAGWSPPPPERHAHFLRSSFELPIWSPGPVPVLLEVHWGLGQERRYDIDVEEVLGRAQPLDVGGRAVRRLDASDAAAHLLMHHVQHYFDRRLKWAIDLGFLVREPGFAWEVVAERLRRWGGSRAAGLALSHLARLFPDVVPSRARALLPTPAWRRLLALPLRSRHPLDQFRGTRRRGVQLVLAALALERARDLPGYLVHRMVRERRARGIVERTSGPQARRSAKAPSQGAGP